MLGKVQKYLCLAFASLSVAGDRAVMQEGRWEGSLQGTDPPELIFFWLPSLGRLPRMLLGIFLPCLLRKPRPL